MQFLEKRSPLKRARSARWSWKVVERSPSLPEVTSVALLHETILLLLRSREQEEAWARALH